MLNETLAQLETQIRQSDTMRAEQKAQLLHLLGTLQAEIAVLAQTHAEHAERVVAVAEKSMQVAIQQAHDPQRVASAIDSLSASVTELEASHPQLVQIVNALSVLLSNIGI